MRKLLIPLCLICFTLLVGCDEIGSSSSGRYTSEKNAAGNFLILDTKTGNVEVLKNEQFVDILKEKDIKSAKTFALQNIPGMPIEIGGVSVKYSDGYLLYKGYMEPIIQTPKEGENLPTETQLELFDRMEALWKKGDFNNSNKITIQFTDCDDFQILSVIITRNSMTRIIDNNSNPIKLSFEGRIQISPKAFNAISGYRLRWTLADWKETDPKKNVKHHLRDTR